MSHLDKELELIKSEVVEMMDLVKDQLVKSREAFLTRDKDLADEIKLFEQHVNASELRIDKMCENGIALLNPVATDLRFMLAVLKINADLERIGDHAYGIAKFIAELPEQVNQELSEAFQLEKMFAIAVNMLSKVIHGYKLEDTKMARKAFKMDQALNIINRELPDTFATFVAKYPDMTREALYYFTTIRKLERTGDMIKNIAEEIIFHLDAKVTKHKKKLPPKVD